MDKYLFFAKFTVAEEGGYCISFPELEGCFSECDTIEEGMKNAKEVLELFLWGLEEDEEDIPNSMKPEDIELEKGEFLIPISVYMPIVREEMNNKTVNKNLTLPYWLNKEAMKHKINFSQILQEGLKEVLGITEKKRV
ncbi:type II toxin-antitoxin system HicB family antitoxin [Clostridioides sp. ZZV14-6044]|uniref:type II toxin-antitoxin system HicB family antitoxin n=1 Tax=unclassified Clostridioides TaxID=2635829 RepID=UPI001D12AD31|nr:type II toxin-antitoxin system HicB family antitoxin [Clostridioides sp. ZZV14-6154]MCC0720830.1 type II toxin-antitoxin system HicB family antitoxin [Clostridioides sp. ZZV14-6104]MCC0725268.1 type II toxin-antitoxin system HicB family antitoxin [Clostridioides sp. ZZV14-6045]MCC0741361.1 type II toxin-antitoxin system HicB family antitoxin [Clostridioides sp. ZZV14-6044]MCC0749542.1 type II toxin-antitoxin system HicB family antitoxin [Clostridioides sp. ZZV13-5731]